MSLVPMINRDGVKVQVSEAKAERLKLHGYRRVLAATEPVVDLTPTRPTPRKRARKTVET